jgi:hypothetical protein
MAKVKLNGDGRIGAVKADKSNHAAQRRPYLGATKNHF